MVYTTLCNKNRSDKIPRTTVVVDDKGRNEKSFQAKREQDLKSQEEGEEQQQ
eukprot:m.195772 g.195772  ORF g.195772 m.195772 type:complete len:52 (+) comp14898_c0_seq2:35-190(+)